MRTSTIFSAMICLGLLSLSHPAVAEEVASDGKAEVMDKEIVDVPLDPRLAHQVPVTELEQGITTIMFPGPISAINLAQVQALTPGAPAQAPFIIDFKEKNSFFSVRSLAAAGARGMVTVVYDRHIYVIKFESTKKGLASVNFVLPRPLGPVMEARRPVIPEMLVGLIETAKEYHVLKQSKPEEVANIVYFAPKGKENAGTSKDVITHFVEVMRFDAMDTLVFHCILENLTDSEINYDPAEITVAYGTALKTLRCSSADAPGRLPARAMQHIYFTITGDGMGHQGHIAVDNPFKVLIPFNNVQTATDLAKRLLKENVGPDVAQQASVLRPGSREQIERPVKPAEMPRRQEPGSKPAEPVADTEPEHIEKTLAPSQAPKPAPANSEEQTAPAGTKTLKKIRVIKTGGGDQ